MLDRVSALYVWIWASLFSFQVRHSCVPRHFFTSFVDVPDTGIALAYGSSKTSINACVALPL
jgi:hypothetical protein